MKTVCYETKILLFWRSIESEVKAMYSVVVNGEEVCITDKTFCRIEGLFPATEYKIELIATFSNEKKSLGKCCCMTDIEKEIIDVTKAPFYAVGDGITMNTGAIQKALDSCGTNQKVLIPKGIYLCGGLKVRSNTEIVLEEGAVLQGCDDPEAYLPKIWSRFEGIERYSYQSLLNIGDLQSTGEITAANIKIHGQGSIVGGGFNLLCNTCGIGGETEAEKRENLILYQQDLDKKTAHRERGRLISVCNAENVVIDGLKLGNSPSWNVHLIYSKNIVTCGCHIFSKGIWNGDGWDPDSSEDCTLFDCVFDTGDDCIAIKSGKNPEGNLINKPCRNVDVFSCRVISGKSHGVAIGSEISGGIENVQFWDCDFSGSFFGLHIKTTEKRGGYIKNVKFSDGKISRLIMRQVGYNDDGEGANCLTEISDIELNNVELTYSYNDPNFPLETDGYVYVNGFAKAPEKFNDIRLKNITIDAKEGLKEYSVANCKNVIFNGEKLM